MNTETIISIAAAGAIVLTAAVWDFQIRKIPNVLTMSAVLLGILFHTALSGVEGIIFSVLGCGTGFMVLFIPYYLRVMGAGDVKLMMALGAWIGTTAVMFAMTYTALWGGLVGMLMMYRAGLLHEFLTRLYWLAGERNMNHSVLQLESSACPPLPYGAVIALGFSTHIGLRVFVS